MEIKEAIKIINQYDMNFHWNDGEPIPAEQLAEAFDLAISALEKQERSNAQNVNSTHRSRPNALESLKILESAKDENGCVPMSLVRLAFRNVLEQDRWVPTKERLPEEDCECRVTFKNDFGKSVFNCYWNGGEKQFESWDYFLDCFVPVFGVTAWKPIEEPYTEEE